MIKFCLVMLACGALIVNFTGCSDSETNAQSRDSKPTAGSKPANSRGPFNGKIRSDSILTLGIGKTVQSQIDQTKFGKLYFVFQNSNENEFESEIPDEALHEIDSYLRLRLKQCGLEKPSDINDAVQNDKEIGLMASKTESNLQGNEIESPDGRRKISYEEAGELIEYVGISSIDVCNSLKKNPTLR